MACRCRAVPGSAGVLTRLVRESFAKALRVRTPALPGTLLCNSYDVMYLRERLLRTLRGEKADRVPLVLAGFHFQNREQVAKLYDPLKRRIAERIFDETHFEVNVSSCARPKALRPV